MNTKQNKLGTYLAVTAGVGCAASTASGAVTFYGPGSTSSSSGSPTPLGFNIFSSLTGFAIGCLDCTGSGASIFRYDGEYLTRGDDMLLGGPGLRGMYASAGVFVRGAIDGDENYANMSFDGNDGIYESVAQFHLDGIGGGYLIAIAANDAPNAADALSISAGKAMIEAAAIPEPSGHALLALGSVGLAARRRRKS